MTTLRIPLIPDAACLPNGNKHINRYIEEVWEIRAGLDGELGTPLEAGIQKQQMTTTNCDKQSFYVNIVHLSTLYHCRFYLE